MKHLSKYTFVERFWLAIAIFIYIASMCRGVQHIINNRNLAEAQDNIIIDFIVVLSFAITAAVVIIGVLCLIVGLLGFIVTKFNNFLNRLEDENI